MTAKLTLPKFIQGTIFKIGTSEVRLLISRGYDSESPEKGVVYPPLQYSNIVHPNPDFVLSPPLVNKTVQFSDHI